MKNNVKVMTEVFRTALVWEKYVKLWSDALKCVDSKLENNNDKIQKALSGIEEEEFIIATSEHMNEIYKDNAKKDIRKYRRIIFLVVGIISTVLIIAYVLRLLGLTKISAAFFMVLIPFISGLGPMIILGVIIYCLYNWWKRKNDIKSSAPQKVSTQILVSENNVKSYNSFLQKVKSENVYLMAKKQIIVSELNKAKKTLNQIYSYGLIPERYQGLIQVATIYGYLYNCICTSICGHGGVYERYEDDLIKGVIVNQLYLINEKLNMVIKNQQELKKTLDSIDMTLSGIKREIEHGNEMLSDIRTNSAIGAAAQQQSAAHQEYISTAVWRNL